MDKTTFKRSFRLAVAVGAILAFAVGAGAAREWWERQHQPSREPDVSGRVVSMAANDGRTRFLVQSPQGGMCSVITQASTRVQTRTGKASRVAVGQTVSVWHTGIVLESYPAQVYAEWVIIESDEAKAE